MTWIDVVPPLEFDDKGRVALHDCEGELPALPYGPAISYCRENWEGQYWVGNDEYNSQVNFCPYCGKKAPVQVEIKALEE